MIDRGASRGLELYRVLGVDPDAAGDELARAYRRRLRQLHPDTSPFRAGADRAAPGGAGRHPELADVQHAYQVLRDPDRRAHYDAQRRTTAGPPARTATAIPIRVRVRAPRAPSHAPMLAVGPVRVAPLPTRSRPWGR